MSLEKVTPEILALSKAFVDSRKLNGATVEFTLPESVDQAEVLKAIDLIGDLSCAFTHATGEVAHEASLKDKSIKEVSAELDLGKRKGKPCITLKASWEREVQVPADATGSGEKKTVYGRLTPAITTTFTKNKGMMGDIRSHWATLGAEAFGK